MDKFKIFNKIKINTDKYEEVETNNEELKNKILGKLNTSERSKKQKERRKKMIKVIASICVVAIGIGVLTPSLADNMKKRLPEFETMLDKIKNNMQVSNEVEYDPSLYTELEKKKEEHKKSKLVATPINVSCKDEGLKITIENAFYDKKKLYLNMTLETDEPFNESKYKKTVYESPYGDGVTYMNLDILEMYMNNVKADNYGWEAGIVEFIDENILNLSYLIELDINNDKEDVDFKISFKPDAYNNSLFSTNNDGKWTFDFNIKATDDNLKSIVVNKKDGDYTLKKINVTDTYIEVEMELPFQESLGNPHNNFIIVHDNKGRELEMSTGSGGKNKIYTQINELINIGEIPPYIDILVCTNYGEEDNPLSKFRVNLSEDI